MTLSQNALPHVYPSEFIIVAVVLLAWLGAICVFVNKWAKIQIVEPSDHRWAIRNTLVSHYCRVGLHMLAHVDLPPPTHSHARTHAHTLALLFSFKVILLIQFLFL